MILLNEQYLSPAAWLNLNQVGCGQNRISEAGENAPVFISKNRIGNGIFFFESNDPPFFTAGADGHEFDLVRKKGGGIHLMV